MAPSQKNDARRWSGTHGSARGCGRPGGRDIDTLRPVHAGAGHVSHQQDADDGDSCAFAVPTGSRALRPRAFHRASVVCHRPSFRAPIVFIRVRACVYRAYPVINESSALVDNVQREHAAAHLSCGQNPRGTP